MKLSNRWFLRVRPEPANPVRVDFNGINFLDIVKAYNISEGGLSVVVPHEFKDCEINFPVSLIVSLPQPVKETIIVEGIIRYVSPSHKLFGVAFVKLKEEDRKKIRRYIACRLKDVPWFTRLRYAIKSIWKRIIP